jgi:hypothetical protein
MIPKKIFCPKCLLPERDIAFKDDLTDFYNYILENMHKEKINSNETLLSFATYKKFYKAKKISMLHFSKRKEESAKEYYEVLFGEILSFFFNDNINSQLFSIYTLYSLYYTQVNTTFYQVNIILEFLKGVNSLINKLIKDKNNNVRQIGFTVYNMIKKMKEDDAFSIGVIPGLKSIILNKYLVPIEKKENVYSYTKEINNYMKELKDKETKDNNEKNIVEQKNKNDLDYEIIKKSIINEIKDINMDQDDYINFINSNYCDNDLNKNSGDLMNYNKYFIGNTNLKKEDLKPGEITQFDIIFNKYIKE